jgi:hypothetical protein
MLQLPQQPIPRLRGRLEALGSLRVDQEEPHVTCGAQGVPGPRRSMKIRRNQGSGAFFVWGATIRSPPPALPALGTVRLLVMAAVLLGAVVLIGRRRALDAAVAMSSHGRPQPRIAQSSVAMESLPAVYASLQPSEAFELSWNTRSGGRPAAVIGPGEEAP